MNPSLRHQLTLLDRALLAMLEERARLAAEVGDGSACEPAFDDLSRRASGDLPSAAIDEVFRAVQKGCAAGARGTAR